MDAHAHHGPRYSQYLMIFTALIVLTATTVLLSYSGLSHGTKIFLAFTIASIKALLVAAIFMHLKFEHRVIVAFAGTAILLALIFILAIAPDIGIVE